MAKKRTIGQLAKEAGVGVETIRFYERRGLIQQPVSRGGYRDYDDHTLATVRYIRIAQRLGLSLKDIAELKGRLNEASGFCASVRATVTKRLAALEQEMAELRRLESELTGFLDRCSSRSPDLPCPVLVELGRLDSAVSPQGERNGTHNAR
jgi:DNA-binding transcriptional MerR regulator